MNARYLKQLYTVHIICVDSDPCAADSHELLSELKTAREAWGFQEDETCLHFSCLIYIMLT